MKELKILGVLVFFTGLLYLGVETYAHHVMHPKVSPPDYTFSDLQEFPEGDPIKGKELVAMNCTACHGMEIEGLPAPMTPDNAAAAFGVVPPDLSTSGKIYSDRFLAAYIKNPVEAALIAHRFDKDYAGQGKMHPMPAYNWMNDEDIASMVAYMKQAAPDSIQDSKVYDHACGRCHNMKYVKYESPTPPEAIKTYMGSVPPDLSMMIMSRGEHYLHTFINNPQKHLEGTVMPRVGLTEEAEVQVVAYMEKAGNPKKEEQKEVAQKVMIYLVIFTIFAYLWKLSVWRELH